MKNNKIFEFVDKVSSKSATPSGGSVLPLVLSLASSLNTMACNLTVDKEEYKEYKDEVTDIKNKCTSLSNYLLDFINHDIECFKPLSKMYSKKNKDTNELDKAVEIALSSPIELMELTNDIIDICDRLSLISNKLLLSDISIAVMLAHSVLYGCHTNIIVNTKLMSDKNEAKLTNETSKQILEEYSNKALSVYSRIEEELLNG